MKNRNSRFNAIVSLLLLVCLLVTSCVNRPSNNDINTTNNNTITEAPGCSHTETVLVGAKEATCIEKGYTGDTVCKACAAIVTPGSELPILNHTFDAGTVTKEPTCIETGINTFTCTGCGFTQTASIGTVDHKDVYHDAQDGTHFHTCKNCLLNEHGTHTPKDEGTYHAASCTEPAYIELVCADCRGRYKVYSETELATGHTLGEWDIVEESTCSLDGLKAQSCTNEGCNYVNEIVIPSNGQHFVVFSGYTVAPNCCDDGIAVYTCRYCNYTEDRIVAKTGIHNYEPLENVGDGWVRKECSVCKDVVSSFDASTLVSAELNAESIDKEASLEMNMESAAIQFPKEVVSQITSGSNVEISASVLDENAKKDAIEKIADADKQAALADAPVYDFTVSVDNQKFQDTFSTKVCITVPYDNGDADADGLVIFYIAENGEIEEINDVVYNSETKEIIFFVSHFSYYAVAYVETQEMRCKRGLHDYEATNLVVAPSCHSFGYTLYECVCCHRTTIDDIYERIAHNYGSIIEANPTCENGDYTKRICQNDGCGDILYLEFKGATGHKVDVLATCETGSTCTKCGAVVVRPRGHNWTDWKTVVEATAIQNGIRRRWCLNCGKVDESTISSTGSVEAIKYESYTDIFNLIFNDLFGVENSEIQISFTQYRNQIDATVKLEKDNNGYKGYMKFIVTEYNDTTFTKVTGTRTLEGYYDNGLFVGGFEDDSYDTASDLNEIIPLTIDALKEVAADLHEDIDYYARQYLEVAREFVGEYKGIYGADINAILEEAGLSYTVDQLDDLLDSIETVYAYLSLKLGFTTSQQMHGDVLLPSSEDFRSVLSAFMDVAEKDGVTTYSLSSGPIIDATREILEYFEENLEQSIGDFIYELIGEQLAEYNGEFVDCSSVIEFIESEFPGTLTVSDAVDKIIALSEETGLFTLDSIYAFVDAVVTNMTGEEFDSEALVTENGDQTIDDLLKMAFDTEEANIADLYDMIIQYANEITVGDLQFRGATVATLIDNLLAMLDSASVPTDFSFAVDADGRLVNLVLNHEFYFTENGKTQKIEHFNFSIQNDPSITVEIPEAVKPSLKDVNSYYDANGNLVIEGLDPAFDYDFSISGRGYADTKDVLTLDQAMTDATGFDVYVLDREYWTNQNYLAEYFVYNGKYYSTNSDSSYRVFNRYAGIISTDEYLNNMKLFFTEGPSANQEAIGYLEGYEQEILVYNHNYGIVYQIDGEWRFSSNYGYVDNSVKGNGYYTHSDMPLAEVGNQLSLSHIQKWNYYYYDDASCVIKIDNEFYDILQVYYAIGDTSQTIPTCGIMMDGELKIIDSLVTFDYDWISIYNFETPVDSIPQNCETSEWTTTVWMYDNNGELTQNTVKRINFFEYLPTYYIKIGEGTYLYYGTPNYSDSSSYLYKENPTYKAETMTLPTGNTLYIVGTSTDNYYTNKYGYDVVYGYASTASGVYVQTIVLMQGGEIVDVLYRNGTSETMSIALDKPFKVEDYLTRSNDKYIISAELFAKLKEFCTVEGTSYSISIYTEALINGKEVDFGYYVGSYYNLSDMHIEDLFGSVGGEETRPNLFYELFGNTYYPDVDKYTVVKNNDGSITVVFANGLKISNLNYRFGNALPADDILVRDNDESKKTGLEIYKYEISGSSTYDYNASYVLQNGKYYGYYHQTVYDFETTQNVEDFLKNWSISNMAYRFDMIGSGDLPANLSVYETEIRLNDFKSWYGTPYITCYTFFIKGEIYVAVDAKVTGESLLTFEDYMPLNEYMNSLELVVDSYDDYYWSTCNINGVETAVYSTTVRLYETDGNGNRISNDSKYYFYVQYYMSGNTRMYITSYQYLRNALVLGSQVTPDQEVLAGTKTVFTEECFNGTFTIVNFSYESVSSYHYKYQFIKLAGRYYEYNDNDYDYYYYYNYLNNRIDEGSFEKEALNKVWYYMVEDTQTGECTYYTEFIPSDYGFTPAGKVVDPANIDGWEYSYTFFGYTPDGNVLYEVAYYINEGSNNFQYTVEKQSDGTVFYHVDGSGYLKDQAGYYVKARKVTLADGTTSIVCSIRQAYIRDERAAELNFLDKYAQVEGNTITISAELLELAAHAKTRFEMSFELTNSNSNGNYAWFDYYQLESLFMMAK